MWSFNYFQSNTRENYNLDHLCLSKLCQIYQNNTAPKILIVFGEVCPDIESMVEDLGLEFDVVLLLSCRISNLGLLSNYEDYEKYFLVLDEEKPHLKFKNTSQLTTSVCPGLSKAYIDYLNSLISHQVESGEVLKKGNDFKILKSSSLLISALNFKMSNQPKAVQKLLKIDKLSLSQYFVSQKNKDFTFVFKRQSSKEDFSLGSMDDFLSF